MIVGNPGIGAAIRRPNSFTKFHIRFDGELNSFVDMCGHQLTAHGNVIQRYPGIFLGKSGFFDGNGDYITSENSTDLSFGTGDFTIGYSVKTAQTSTAYAKQICNSLATYDYWGIGTIFESGDQNVHFTYCDTGIPGGWRNIITNTGVSNNSHHYIEVDRKNGIFYVSVDGQIKVTDSTYTTTSVGGSNLSTYLTLGYNTALSAYFLGDIDELFILKGIALHTTNFTPPTRRK